MSKDYLLRVVSSLSHQCSVDELIARIKKYGTDRYDTEKKQVFDDFYGKHSVDFFAEQANQSNFESELDRMVKEFPTKAKGDRGYAVHPDVAIIYGASKCRMINNVYDKSKVSDCYQFITNPLAALVEVRRI